MKLTIVLMSVCLCALISFEGSDAQVTNTPTVAPPAAPTAPSSPTTGALTPPANNRQRITLTNLRYSNVRRISRNGSNSSGSGTNTGTGSGTGSGINLGSGNGAITSSRRGRRVGNNRRRRSNRRVVITRNGNQIIG